MDPVKVGKADIIEAAIRLKSFIHRTPVLTSEALDSISGAKLYFKCENFQKAGAFKARGAANAVFSLKDQELKNGVATHSSGNHAAALSLAARNRNVSAYIVMPKNSSRVKIEAVKSYGGIITFCESTLSSREKTLQEVIRKVGAVDIHPYDHPAIIAGQATAALELIEDSPTLDIIMAPVGGGGLLSGTALSSSYFSKNSRIIAGEPKNACDAFHSFYQKKYVPSVNPDTIADGLRTSLGHLTYPIILSLVSDILLAEEEDIIETMKLVWESMKIIIEPSSAVPLAALLKNKSQFYGKRVGIILSGGNVDLLNLPWQQEQNGNR